jgi:hypothetical protein
MKLDIAKLVKNKKTYPSWSTKSTYSLKTYKFEKGILVYYKTKTNRSISRSFPNKLNLTPKLLYVLGFLKGEGSTSLGNSNYRRFTITNSDPKIMKMVLDELDKHNIFKRNKIIKKSIHLVHHLLPDQKVINYWSKELELDKNKFKCFKLKETSPFGVCHVYISDVLLRRVVDLIHKKIMN